MSKVKNILNGYKNYLIGSDEATIETAKERAKICSICPQAKNGIHAAILPDSSLGEIKGMYCGECGCPLSPKVRSENDNCPIGKW